mmetsp:Transcript_57891/g.91969  ORF Transcript_57891/g.91969 Transcript_57891/m.91969 type:complete len:396 (+) Transcript_57891:33-1220(+)
MAVSVTDEQAELSNHMQALTNLIISVIWLCIYIYSFRFCTQLRSIRHKKPTHTQAVNSLSVPTETRFKHSYTEDYGDDDDEPVQRQQTDLVTNDDEHQSIGIVTTLYPLVYVLRYIGNMIQWHFAANEIDSSFDAYFLSHFMHLMFVIGNVLFYLSITLRFQYGVKFNDYVYIIKLGRKMQLICYAFLVIIPVLNTLYFVFLTLSIVDANTVSYKATSSHLFWILAVMNLGLGAALIGSFCHKILKFIRLKGKLSVDSDEFETIELSQSQRQFLGIAIKYALLCGIAVVFTSVQFCGWMVRNFEMLSDENTSLWFKICWDWLFDVVLLTNFYTLWLTFPFADAHYRRVCGCCHSACKKSCHCLVIAWLRKQVSSEKKQGKGVKHNVMRSLELSQT